MRGQGLCRKAVFREEVRCEAVRRKAVRCQALRGKALTLHTALPNVVGGAVDPPPTQHYADRP